MRPSVRIGIEARCRSRRLVSAQRACFTSVFARNDNTSTSTQPFKGFAVDTLDAPLHSITPRTQTPPAPPPPEGLPKTEDEAKLARARVVFGSRLAGPVERAKAKEDAAQNVAGILVPPKPVEPDNCCMSGCANCVWDLFRDDMEEWAAKSAEARTQLAAQRKQESRRNLGDKMPAHVADTMDEDGGGSAIDDIGQVDLFEGIPVGIREFMKTEKKLKERHRNKQTLTG